MEKADKKVLYMNDHPMFRVVMGALIVSYGIFKLLWTYFLSPLSEIYRDTFTLFDVVSVVEAILCYVFFVYLTFVPLNKSWNLILIFECANSCFSMFMWIMLEFINYRERLEVFENAELNISIQSVLLNILLIVPFLLPLSRRKISKYLFVLFTAFCLIAQSNNFITEICNYIDVSKYGFDGWCHANGVLLEDHQEKYHFLNNAIHLMPIAPIYYFIFALLFKTKKKGETEIAPERNNDQNNYNIRYANVSIPVGYQSGYSQPNENQNNKRNMYEHTAAMGLTNNEQPKLVYQEPNQQIALQSVQSSHTMMGAFTQSNKTTMETRHSFCGQCGCKLSGDFLFCPMCGNKI